MSQPDLTSKPSLTPNWSSLAKIIAAAAAVAGFSLHFMGQVTHRTYLHQMGASAGHFPKTSDWLMVSGYYTLVERLMILVSAFLTHLWQIALAIILLGLYMYAMERLGRWLKNKDPVSWLAWSPAWASDLIRNLFASTFMLVGIPAAIMVVMVIILLPAVLGETAGKDIAAKDLELFQAVCQSEDPSVSPNCSQIIMGDKVLAIGYIIDTSPTHVAIFDPLIHRTMVMETSGKVIVGRQASVAQD